MVIGILIGASIVGVTVLCKAYYDSAKESQYEEFYQCVAYKHLNSCLSDIRDSTSLIDILFEQIREDFHDIMFHNVCDFILLDDMHNLLNVDRDDVIYDTVATISAYYDFKRGNIYINKKGVYMFKKNALLLSVGVPKNIIECCFDNGILTIGDYLKEDIHFEEVDGKLWRST